MCTKEEIVSWFRDLQLRICTQLERIDGKGKFAEDKWLRPGGGGGLTRVIQNGNVFEKGGVNFSEVHGEVPEVLKKQFDHLGASKSNFFASGVSIVMHPLNPFVPIIHMNVRYLEMGNEKWFGGGIDLTPYYVIEDDAAFFHSTLKKMCDKHNSEFYHDFKRNADDYFFIPHRNETRGVGGIFFDRLGENNNFNFDDRFSFVKETGEIFISVYEELVSRNRHKEFGEKEIEWQRIRRGRYVEFNLVYDKGTKFGLETEGRTESILMSLPPIAKWEYDYKIESSSAEVFTMSRLKKGIEWIK